MTVAISTIFYGLSVSILHKPGTDGSKSSRWSRLCRFLKCNWVLVPLVLVLLAGSAGGIGFTRSGDLSRGVPTFLVQEDLDEADQPSRHVSPCFRHINFRDCFVAAGHGAFTFIGYNPHADLEDAEISHKPPNWTGVCEDRKCAALRLALAAVRGASLRGRDLRYASAKRAFLAAADLREVDLSWADLESVQLQGAKLGGVHLENADLRRATGLSKEQLSQAQCDSKTRLPEGLSNDSCNGAT